jgi:hypothetical protein
MADSVLAYASEWVGVVYGDDGAIKDPIQVVQTPGGGSTLPQMVIAEYMDRMIATLVRGGDLSTISRRNSNGSSVQDDETDALLEDDCAMVSETLQTQLDRLVIRMVHGDEKPAAYIVVNPPTDEDLARDLAIDEGLVRLGVKQAPADLAERYGREIAENSEPEDLKRQDAKDAKGTPREVALPMAGMTPAANEAEYFQADALRAALSEDLQPLGDALFQAMEAGDLVAMQAALKKISKSMPELVGEPAAVVSRLTEEFTKALTEDPTE